ncbi:hypothetical protein [Tenacibaculum sp. C7A-26P2]|uniref:hypothetical protein n=1 Tax=Tenacibaculum sp. C7A-26P2 TaxID=3447504 RepID=UPI003F82E1F9
MTKKYYYIVLFFIITFSISCSSDDSPEEIPVTVNTQNMNFSIDENPNENQSIGTVIGSTNQGSVQFSINEQNPANSFTINSSTGELFVDNVSVYDYEIITEITGKIKVFNGDISSESIVSISISDVVEDVFNGNVLLKNQEDVDAFALNEYRVINGKIDIFQGDDPGTPITDLSNLNTLEEIHGDLSITANGELTTLNGLNNITTAETCAIFNNPNLKNISALQNISTLKSISVKFNPKITSLNCFSNITILEGFCEITENNSLTSLNGLNNITSITGNLSINQNQNLNNIFDLNSITTINGALILQSNPNLINLNGLNNLQTLSKNLTIINNTNLFDINGLQNLSSFNGRIVINLNTNLQNLNGLVNLTSIEFLQILRCQSLENLNALTNLTSITDGLFIQKNNSLNDFCGLTPLVNNGFSGSYSVENNLFNPSVDDITNGNCSN